MCSYLRGENHHDYSDVGVMYFDEFNMRFWLRPGNY